MTGFLLPCIVVIDMISVSENEIFQIARKACLASRIFEDYAHDLGQAIVLIHGKGMDGCKELELMLSEKKFHNHKKPKISSSQLLIERLHPIKTAISMIDWLLAEENRKASIIEGTDFPIIISALLQRATIGYGGYFHIRDCKNNLMIKITQHSNLRSNASAFGKSTGVEIHWKKKTLSQTSTKTNTTMSETNRSKTNWLAWEKLTARAFKTYVPETEQSRLQGAGAGIVDYD